MRLRALVAAAAVAIIVPAVPAFADGSDPSPTPSPSESATLDPTPDPTEEPTDPGTPTDPAPTDPAPSDPTPTDPTPTDPTPSDPTPTDPTTDPTDPPTDAPAPLTVTGAWSNNGYGYKVGTSATLSVTVPEAAGQTVVVAWHLRNPSTGSVTATTTADVTLDATGYATFVVKVPTVGGGTYDVVLDVTAGDSTGTGTITGFLVDAKAPVVTLTRSLSTFYPYPDKYQDSVAIKAGTNELSKYNVAIYKGTTLVKTLGALTTPTFTGTKSFTWTGVNGSGTRVAAGTYTVKASVTDRVGNLTTKTVSVVVSSKHLQWRTSSYKHSPKYLYAGKSIGSCSTLKSNPRGWSGGYGLYSETKCKSSNTIKNRAELYGGMTVPKAFNGNYKSLRIQAYGGAAVGHTKGAYLNCYFWNTNDDLVYRTQFHGSVGWHDCGTHSASNLVFDKTTQPYVLWYLGLSEGSRYDLKTYKVTVTYQVLA